MYLMQSLFMQLNVKNKLQILFENESKWVKAETD